MTGRKREVCLVAHHHLGPYDKACASHVLSEVARTKTSPVNRRVHWYVLLHNFRCGVACVYVR
jgi:hypothetical protein